MADPIVVVNPATGAIAGRYPTMDAAAVDAALARAAAASTVWATVPVAARCARLRRVAALLRERRAEYARLITTEMGKPLAEARAEIDKCAFTCDHLADHAAEYLADTVVATPARDSRVTYEPLGVVLAVMPWNYPFWQVIRFAAAALAAGNCGLLKHSPNVTGSALELERLFVDAGFAPGVFSALVVNETEVPAVVAGLIGDPRIAAVSVTGSEWAGLAVATAAARALKKCVLELGGSDPFVVLDDADLEAAVAAAATSRFGNAGQSCISAKRFIVADPLADEFTRLLKKRVDALVVGDPTRDGVTVGPLARPDLVDAIERQVRDSIDQGATLVTGGDRMDAPGSFYAPTILDHVQPHMTVFREETFGPVAAVCRARDDAHAIELANDTTFGLAAAVWSTSGRGLAVGRQINSGALFVNAVVASDARVPFGGTKRSGYGRELAGEGVREFTNVRTIWIGPNAK